MPDTKPDPDNKPSQDGTRGWSDATTTLAELSGAVQEFNAARDWSQYHCPRNLAMALSVECAELLELYLWSRDDGPQPPVPSREPRVADELADVAVCLLNLAAHSGVDLAAAVDRKMLKNGRKYPVALARGRMEKSTELRELGNAPD